jgi:hypothetical protein
MIFISFMGTFGDYLPGAESRGKLSDDPGSWFDSEVHFLQCILILVGNFLGIRSWPSGFCSSYWNVSEAHSMSYHCMESAYLGSRGL